MPHSAPSVWSWKTVKYIWPFLRRSTIRDIGLISSTQHPRHVLFLSKKVAFYFPLAYLPSFKRKVLMIALCMWLSQWSSTCWTTNSEIFPSHWPCWLWDFGKCSHWSSPTNLCHSLDLHNSLDRLQLSIFFAFIVHKYSSIVIFIVFRDGLGFLFLQGWTPRGWRQNLPQTPMSSKHVLCSLLVLFLVLGFSLRMVHNTELTWQCIRLLQESLQPVSTFTVVTHYNSCGTC